nr:COX assembly mitochondrial protein homolog [Parasteatoda tepidariorum]
MLPPQMGGGPHGLGDPDDTSLRKVEREIMIPTKIREKAKKEKCVAEGEVFSKCCKEASYLMTWKCKAETKALNACLERWYNDEGLKKECTEEYLRQRSEYRQTGKNQKLRRKESVL